MKVVVDQPYDKQTLEGYLDHCHAKAKQAIAAETEATLEGPSGFEWLKFSRIEAHFYNIRHIQHHTGQLGATLRRQGSEGVQWIPSSRL
jgi:uncharacterized damage-inducible protein DinB